MAPTEIEFRTIVKGETSGQTAPLQIAIDDEATWERVWRDHTANQIPAPPAPAIDFGKERVVAVFAGERPSSGFKIEIVSARARPGEVAVIVMEAAPAPGVFVLDVLTAPFHIAAVPRTAAGRVTFERE